MDEMILEDGEIVMPEDPVILSCWDQFLNWMARPWFPGAAAASIALGPTVENGAHGLNATHGWIMFNNDSKVRSKTALPKPAQGYQFGWYHGKKAVEAICFLFHWEKCTKLFLYRQTLNCKL